MAIPELPKVLIEEILCYVPTTYLKRLRSTCKEWNRLFKDDRRFTRKHFDKAAKQFLPLISTKYHKEPCAMSLNLHGIMPSLEVESKIRRVDSDSKYPISTKMENSRVFHCGGLLLCSSQDDESAILVWSPLTGENRWIKTGNRRDKGRTFVLGYYQEDKKPCYKILSFYSDSNDFEIFEFNSDSWRFIDDICPGWSLINPCQCVSLKGNTYMFALDETKTCVSLLKYDYSTEKSILVPLPYKSRCFEETSLSVVREEKLSVLLKRDKSSKTEIWVTNETITKAMVVSWSKVLALDLSSLLEIWYDGSFFLEEEKKVIMISNLWIEEENISEDNLYIVGEDANKVTQVYTIDGCGSAVYNYVPSLVQIERARGKRKRVD